MAQGPGKPVREVGPIGQRYTSVPEEIQVGAAAERDNSNIR